MKTIVLAHREIGCIGLDALLRNGFQIAAVFTRKDDTGANPFHPIAEAAAARGIPVFAPSDINHPFWVARIRRLCPDVLFSFSWPRIVAPAILDIPPHGCLNLHLSLLPRFRGRNPISQALLNGENETGVTLHYMTPQANDGDIVGRKRIPVGSQDNFGALCDKAMRAAAALLDETLPRVICGALEATPQDHADATWCAAQDAEIDWYRTAGRVRNLIRALGRPSGGACSHIAGRNCIFWSASHLPYRRPGAAPGEVLSTSPLTVACGADAVIVDFGQPYGGVYMTGEQMARELNLAPGMRFGPVSGEAGAKKQVLILGANGFIASALVRRLLASGRYEVHGLDLCSDRLQHLIGSAGFHFQEGDLSVHREWIQYHISICDVVIPLAASPAPTECAPNPVGLFELEFEENLRIIRNCVKYGKRLVFPTAPELCGACEEPQPDEDGSTVDTIRMERCLYAFCKQIIDRLICAYGREEGLRYTLFRPFDWIGPGLDRIACIGSSCIVPQMILSLVDGTPILLADGGHRTRCFTDVADGVECLFRIVEDKGGLCNGRIINIGNPNNEISMRALAELLHAAFEQHPLGRQFPASAGIREDSRLCCSGDCPDLRRQRPGIGNARRLLDWAPAVSLKESVARTLDSFLRQSLKSRRPTLAIDKPASLYDIVSVAFPSQTETPQLCSTAGTSRSGAGGQGSRAGTGSVSTR